jgi:hypothetical protein
MDGITFIGTATTIVRLGSFAVLTDPNFLHRGQRAYLGRGYGRGAVLSQQCNRLTYRRSMPSCSHIYTVITLTG